MPMSTAAQATIRSAEVDADASRRAPARGAGARRAARCRDGAHAVTSRCTTRRRAEAARGLAATSSALGRTRLAGHEPELRRAAAAADRQVGRADAAVRGLTKALLDDAVLERVERDHGQPAAGLAHLERASSPSSSWPSSSLTAIRSAWKTRFAGWPWPKRDGRRDGAA